jgi:hypothetical protein
VTAGLHEFVQFHVVALTECSSRTLTSISVPFACPTNALPTHSSSKNRRQRKRASEESEVF